MDDKRDDDAAKRPRTARKRPGGGAHAKPARFKGKKTAGPPRDRAEGDRPKRRFDGDRPGRPFDKDAPRRPPRDRAEGDRPRRPRPEAAGEGAEGRPRFRAERPDGDRPKRRFDGDRPGRSFDKDAPKRSPRDRAEVDRPRRPRPEAASEGTEGRPRFRAERPDGDRPKRGFDGDRPGRPFDKDAPRRVPRDGDERRERPPHPGRRERVEATGAGEGYRKDADGRRERPFRERSDRPRPFAGRDRDDRPGGDRAERPPRRKAEDGGPPKRRAPRAEPGVSAEGERIAKRLARAGIASRREAEGLIEAGRVTVNGTVLSSPAVTVTESDRIEIDGHPIPAIERTRLFLFHKPAGLVTTNRDPEGRKTIFEVLPESLPRLITVGRLDINTEGLLLLTNDGGLARMLELPSTGWLRRYRARVHGSVEQAALDELKHGSSVDGVFYGAVEATLERVQGSNAWLTVGLREGKNREVKNILGGLGLEVSRLIRISYGPFQLGELGEGEVQEIKGKTLRDQLGERLIEEAGANFDASVSKPFPNRPVRRGDEADRPERPERAARPARPLVEGEGGLIKRGRMDRTARRDDALGRLSTRPPRKEGKPRREDEQPARDRRSSNVWMAPGARPAGKKADRPDSGDKRGSGDRPRPAPGGKGKPRGGKPGADRRR